MRHNFPLIVFSHLRWDFVYQRPQHLLSRMAANRRVIFIEEPIYDRWYEPYFDRHEPAPNVLVCKPHTRVGSGGFSDEEIPTLQALLRDFVEAEELTNYALWLYTPMALPLAQTLRPCAVIYDCMDELSAFKNAPPKLLEREQELLQWADVVFTGGPSLYRAKLGRHSNLHCFPSSVDAEHFRQALTIPEAQDQAAIARPRLGFYGVIDERMDLELLDEMARLRPEWQIVMAGPVVKIDPSVLPRRDNLHFLGPRTYDQLPSYLAGWDVCLLPFARNESTKFISPTKTLEYMAAEKLIVSTPITDVAEPYGEIVYLGSTPQQFIAACEKALYAPEGERETRLSRGREVLASTSWHSTAQAMEQLIEQATEQRRSLTNRKEVVA